MANSKEKNSNFQQEDYLTKDKTNKFLDSNLWARLGEMLKPFRISVIFSLIFIIIAEFLPMYQPMLIKKIIDGPIKEKDINAILPFALFFLGIVIISGIFKYFSFMLSMSISLKIIHNLRLSLFKKVQTYKLDFFKKTPIGRLMTRLTGDIDLLSTMFSDGFINMLASLFMIIFPASFMFYLNWKLALICLGATPLMILATSIFRIKVREINSKIRTSIAELNTRMQESFSGNYIIQIFGKSQHQWESFNKVNDKLKHQWFKNVKYFSFYFPVLHSLTDLSIFILYFVGGYYFLKNQISIGTILQFSIYMGLFFRPLKEISDKYTMLQSGLAASERIFTLFDIDAELQSGNLTQIPNNTCLSFNNICFSYKKDEKILNNINFTVKEKTTLAIVGATGSGKSTILSLCNNFYHPDSGTIKFCDKSLSDFKRNILQKKIAYIPQDVYLFSESIAFNIALSEDYDLQKIKDACEYVNAHHFIAQMPDGYLTRLRHRGENISTGQRQLLAFARALYQEPSLLLLDEATSSIDIESEELIQQALNKLTHQVTSIVVAHRLSTIKNADKILVLHKGKIVEEGKHDELLNLNGFYKNLYELQGMQEG